MPLFKVEIRETYHYTGEVYAASYEDAWLLVEREEVDCFQDGSDVETNVTEVKEAQAAREVGDGG